MEERTEGLILRTRPLTETSTIVHWLTRDFGRLATVAKGARRAKSPFAGKLDLFYLADLSFQRSRRSELHALRETSVRDFHPALRQELAYLQQASYFAQLIEQTTETETPVPAVFQLLRDVLQALPQQAPRPLTIFAFETKLLRELGLDPIAQSKLTPGAREFLNQAAASDWPAIARLRPSPTQTTELRQFLQGFLTYHVGRIPSGRVAASSDH